MKSFNQLSAILSLIAVMVLTSACADSNNPSFTEASELDAGIVGGVPVSATDEIAKSTVGLSMPGQGVFCSAVLVAKNLVVTAAHCTAVSARPKDIEVVFGTNLKGKLQTRQVLGGKVTDAWPKLNPTKEKGWGDIAVLRFDGEAPAGYAAANILTTSAELKNGMKVVLAGYGLASMSPQVDPEKLMKTTVALTDAKYSPTELKFNQYNGKGACHGDSGGPAFAKIKNKLYLIGVTSRSATQAGGATCLEGSIYTSVPGTLDFLKKAAKYLNSPEFVPNERIPQPEGM